MDLTGHVIGIFPEEHFAKEIPEMHFTRLKTSKFDTEDSECLFVH